MTQIVGQGFADVLRQRQSLQPLTLAAHDDLAVIPVQIIQVHGEYLPTTQSESGQEQQDGIVTPARPRCAVAALEQSLNLFGRERLWQMRQPPVSDTWHAGEKISLDCSALEEKAQKGAQRCDRQLGTTAANAVGFTKNEAMQVLRPQIPKTRCFTFEAIS